MKFQDYKYERPDMDQIKAEIGVIFNGMESAATEEEFLKFMDQFIAIRRTVETMFTLVSIRHSIDTRDEFYDKESDYVDMAMPQFQDLAISFYHRILASPFRDAIEKKYGKHLLNLAEVSVKAFKPEIIEDLQEENKLSSEYSKLVASASILFDGEERNLSGLVPYMENPDRSVRKAAYEAYSGFFRDHEADFDRIYDELVKVRDRMAKKIGYASYVEMAYDGLLRTEYGPKEVKAYREAIGKHIVPLVVKLRERQAKRLGLDELKYYDEAIEFTTGNATPKGTPEWIINNGKTMYTELSPETEEFFNFMTDHDLLDLVTKKGKQAGGYCTYIPDHKAPFIFSNFNGTSGDIDVLTHEAGHAFQVYSSRAYEVPEYSFPTYEACEIHSMSMEFFTWPWMKLFFEEDTNKYHFSHLQGTLLFLPYGVSVDEFQHFVYENPTATPEERKLKWREIEKKYLPLKNYDDNEFYDRGGFWFKQLHIFTSPFYYIDYTLAQVCALQFWIRSRKEGKKAWEDYVSLCKEGGSKPFLELVKIAGLQNPFQSETIPSILPEIEAYLDAVDDLSL
ncbi:M3 family oligoendopeptidase [Proteiniclasticum sp. BAD-10]|uniref:M3 family oligoendopeptidase n=1 Tax=Proteiniclasticum sediminis TaxID=2804028 RepID=A0A941HPJ1_9CLOT|nr:M3 family oligoendopeptidase [Proteiniclasticum sediminis]MBR0575399.1 M3 family oligoendopeptidase [Proteiniclasticum sediminis]